MIEFVGLVVAVAVGIWLAVVMLALSLMGAWSVRRHRRRGREGETLVDLLRRRKVIE